MSLDQFKQAVIALIFVSIVIGAMVLALDGFQDGLESSSSGLVCHNDSNTWNATTQVCQNNATDHTVGGGTSTAYNVSQEGLEGTANATSYLSTIGTLIGVSALIAIVIGAFMFVKR